MDKKILDKILSGLSDKNIRFQDLRKVLDNFGFSEQNVQIRTHHFLERRGSIEEAIKNAQIVISDWIDTDQSVGKEIPRPRGRSDYAS